MEFSHPSLTLLYIISSFPAFLGHSFAFIIAVNIYTQGQLSSSPETHPSLWRMGIAFLFLSALTSLASGVQVIIKTTTDQDFWFLTLLFKVPLACVACVLVYQMWKKMYDLIAAGLAWKAIKDLDWAEQQYEEDNKEKRER